MPAICPALLNVSDIASRQICFWNEAFRYDPRDTKHSFYYDTSSENGVPAMLEAAIYFFQNNNLALSFFCFCFFLTYKF